MAGLNFYDRQHIQKILIQQNNIATIFNEFILQVAPFLSQWQERNTANVWIRNLVVEKNVDRALEQLQSSLLANISSFQIDAWKRSDMKNEDFIKQYIKGMSINANVKQGMFYRNAEALKVLSNGFDARGNDLSSAVWNIADNAKTQLEFYLKSGLSGGRNANQISSDVRQLLDKPDKRFHRVKDKKTGNLVLSQPMKDYHPGQGVYRSAKMNALRLTATTTNTAYRSADYDRWSKQDFVLGIKIQRSANNRGPCRICDSMVGEYPKIFKFTGFHPFCICFATPIVMEPEELADYLVDDIIPEDKVIIDIPEKAQSFISDNKEVIGSSYWYRDNFDKEGNLTSVVPILGQNIKARDVTTSAFVVKTAEQKAAIQEKWTYRKVVNTENEIRMNEKFETGVLYDKEGNVIIDKRGAATSVSFTAEECAKMKDCIFTHNHPRGWMYPEKSLGRIGNSFSREDIMLTVANDVAEMRAVTPNYTFIMKRPVGGWGIDVKELKVLFDKENARLRKEFEERIYSGTLTPERASAVHFHILWKRIAKQTGWDYSKSKTR